MTVPPRSPFTDAIAPWLEALAGRPVGKLQPPVGRPYPHHILYSIPGGHYSGPPLTAPDADVAFVYQVSSVAQADPEPFADEIRTILLGRVGGGLTAGAFVHPPPVIDGWRIIDRQPDGGPAGVEYSGAPPRRVFTVAERFVIHATPA